jgi:hypothetical protein
VIVTASLARAPAALPLSSSRAPGAEPRRRRLLGRTPQAQALPAELVQALACLLNRHESVHHEGGLQDAEMTYAELAPPRLSICRKISSQTHRA